ncbi:hypothetical protein K443DRAFT_665943 [Laccaria amethystina LaAM-08-1]|uniref:Uncharacterized protein n=1 Tax=Laccaria amethystina LaAM-08-1 TaxID=1095629 RepID=A0A0C9XRS4_9AGAR|nr:hypothetical protein K443DRAFT_665943 [Laccaria amethystina LaAM-08-1]
MYLSAVLATYIARGYLYNHIADFLPFPLPSNSKSCTMSDCTPTEFRRTDPLTNPTNREALGFALHSVYKA